MACTRKQVATIDAAFCALPEMFRGFGEDKSRLFAMCLRSEKQHRQGHPAPSGFSAATAARYFAVKWLREYVTNPSKLPELVDYLRLREECYFAAALSVEHAAELREWAKSVPEEFDAIDYAKCMEG